MPTTKKATPHQSLRRSLSFDSIPTLNTAYSFCYGIACLELAKGPNVTFDDLVEVVFITAASDYPEDIKSSLWLSPEEMYPYNGALRARQMQREEVSKLEEMIDSPSLLDLMSTKTAKDERGSLNKKGGSKGSEKKGIARTSVANAIPATACSLQMGAVLQSLA
jgi:hypothetical protein